MAQLRVRVSPKAARTQVVGVDIEGTVAIRVAAPPHKGLANKELIDFLAKRLGIRKSQIELISGKRSRLKVLEIQGMNAEQIRGRLQEG